MKINKIILFIIVNMVIPKMFGVVSIVYNLRIAEATKQRRLGKKQNNQSSMASVTLFDQFRKRYSGTRENYYGGILNYVYIPNSWYLKVDFAAAHARANGCNLRFSRTQTDDILFTGGYSKQINEEIIFTLSGMFGIPTHKDLSFEGVQFGTGHYGLGVQMDGSFAITQDLNHSIMAAARYLRFFPAHINFFISEQLPSKYKFGAGNVVDLFVAYQGNFGKHRTEFGYNPTFLFGANICPALDTVIERTNFIRSSWFATYRYLVPTENAIHGITLGVSYGFDHRSKIFGNKNIVTAWATWGCNW